MKDLFIIGGTMGIGKTSVCQIMKKKLNKSVFLDGDWCWDMHPFNVNEETKRMVLENICFVLNNYINCSAYENIIFCWVMHEQSIINRIIYSLNTAGCRVHLVSLICNEQSLLIRLGKDIEAGLRTEDIISRSIERMSLYEKLDTLKLDVSELTPDETADYIIKNY